MAGEVMITRKECASCAHNTEEGCDHRYWQSCTQHNFWKRAVMAQPENSGEHASYYEVDITRPKSGGEAYTAECQDIIEALKMDFNEGNAFKALWRRAAARLGNVKKGNEDPLYDAQKIKFYGTRILEQEENK